MFKYAQRQPSTSGHEWPCYITAAYELLNEHGRGAALKTAMVHILHKKSILPFWLHQPARCTLA
jgi:hypothetical protein